MDKKIVLCAAALLTMCNTAAFGLDKALLWRITGNGLMRPSYLFGTWHGAGVNDLDNAEFLASYPGFAEAFGSATMLLTETKMEADNADRPSPEFLKRWRVMTTLPDSLGYEAMVAPEKLYLLDSLTRRFLNAPAQKVKVKPGLLMMTLSSLIEAELNPPDTLSSYGQKMMDAYLWHRAKDEGKRTGGLESNETHLAAIVPLVELSLDEQFEAMDEYLNAIKNGELFDDDAKELLGRVQQAYKAYDIDEVDRILSDAVRHQFPAEFSDKFDKVLVYDRNHAWIPVIEDAAREGMVFVAVGARHLTREYGLIKLLRERGYTVEPVR